MTESKTTFLLYKPAGPYQLFEAEERVEQPGSYWMTKRLQVFYHVYDEDVLSIVNIKRQELGSLGGRAWTITREQLHKLQKLEQDREELARRVSK
jgi:hypothetical protein